MDIKQKLKLYTGYCGDCKRITIHMASKDIEAFDPVKSSVHTLDKSFMSSVCTKCANKYQYSIEDFNHNFRSVSEPIRSITSFGPINTELTEVVNTFIMPSELNFILGLLDLTSTGDGWSFLIPTKNNEVSHILISKKFSVDNLYPCYSECGSDEIFADDVRLLLQSIIEQADHMQNGYIKNVLLSKEINGELSDHIVRVKSELEKYGHYNANAYSIPLVASTSIPVFPTYGKTGKTVKYTTAGCNINGI